MLNGRCLHSNKTGVVSTVRRHEIGTFSVIVKSSHSLRKAFVWSSTVNSPGARDGSGGHGGGGGASRGRLSKLDNNLQIEYIAFSNKMIYKGWPGLWSFDRARNLFKYFHLFTILFDKRIFKLCLKRLRYIALDSRSGRCLFADL